MQTNYLEENTEELLEDQETTVKKITPYKDVSWYIKWCASFLLIGAAIIRAAEVLHFMDVLLSCMGTAMWGYVGYIWHDRALILINTVACAILSVGLVRMLI